MREEKICIYCNSIFWGEEKEECCADRCLESIKRENDHIAVSHLLDYLNDHLQLSSTFNVTIGPMLKVRTLFQKERIVEVGQLAETAFWVEKGYGRYFIKVKDREGLPMEVTIDFCKPRKILVISECFFNDQLCTYYVEMAKGSVIVPFSRSHFDMLKWSAPEAEALANRILSLEKLESLERMEMLKMKPRDRYQEFLRIFGVGVEQFVAIKDIASYLGMMPTYLSRLRGEANGGTKRKVSVVLFFVFRCWLGLT
nr:Crp/Fnr family transcriptional regulator [Pedobacter sp. ASV19]